MPELDIGSGLGQGLQLGAAGFAAGGPLGAAVFGGAGLISGALGGGRRRRTERRLRDRNERLLAMLQGNVDRLGSQTASGTAEFSSGRAELESTIQRQAERDTGAAAARGLTGSSFEIGQAANRARALGRGTSSLLATSETRLSQDRRAALDRLMRGFSLTGQTDLALLGASDRREARAGEAFGSAFEGAATAGLFDRRTQSPTVGESPFIDSVPEPRRLPVGVPVNDPFTLG